MRSSRCATRPIIVFQIAAFFTLLAGCSESHKLDFGGTCALNSDCVSPLVCRFGSCRHECVENRDCPNQLCVKVDGIGVCYAPEWCVDDSACRAPLRCSGDHSCRNTCASISDCMKGLSCQNSFCIPDLADAGASDVLPAADLISRDTASADTEATTTDASRLDTGAAIVDSGPADVSEALDVARQPDLAPVVDTRPIEDVPAPAPDVAAECTGTQMGCTGNAPKTCVDGRWINQTACVGDKPYCESSTGRCVACTSATQCTVSTNTCLEPQCAGGTCAFSAAATTKACGNGSTCNGDGQCRSCAVNDMGCSGNTPIKCSSLGQWVAQTACSGSTPVCRPTDGVCVQCLTETQCPKATADCQVATCDKNVCATANASIGTTCSAGTCTAPGVCGVCAPTKLRCSPTEAAVQLCTERAQWTNIQSCQHVCDASGTTPICTGDCSPEVDLRCDPSNPLVPQSCNSLGKWQSQTACPFVCLAGACTGECIPQRKQCAGASANIPQTCSGAGQWSGTTACSGANPVCQSGECVCVNATTIIDAMEFATDASAQAAYTGDNYGNTGGTITSDGAYRVHSFTATGTFSAVTSGTAAVLLVGGGGGLGGGKYNVVFGGGGGGGQVVYNASFAIAAGNTTATVGVGGAASLADDVAGGTGGGSSLSTLAALGGGGGGALGRGRGGTSGSGRLGGVPNSWAGGGGAGDSAAGQNGPSPPTAGGSGGDGTASAITGTTVYYGGGGASYGTVRPGTPGLGAIGGGSTIEGGNVTPPGADGIVIVRCLASAFSALAAYAESSLLTAGAHSLKIVAAASSSLNRNVTRSLSSTIDLSGMNFVTFDMRASRTGANLKVSLKDASGTSIDVTPTIATADQFQHVTLDISAVADASKQTLNAIVLTVVDASSANTVYIDNLTAQKCSN